MKAYLHLIKFALKSGASVSVIASSSDGPSLWHSKSYKAIKAEVEQYETVALLFNGADGKGIGSALVTPFEPAEETVCDYSTTPMLEQWENIYYN